MQTVEPFEDFTTYVTGRLLVTAPQLSVIDLLETFTVSSAGVTGPLGDPLTVTAALVPAELVATTEKTYVAPFVSPATVHVFVVVVHV